MEVLMVEDSAEGRGQRRQRRKSHISQSTRFHLQRRVKETDEIPQTLAKERAETTQARSDKLGQMLATGICGNNITSSALYVVALCSVPAGKYAPVALALIAVLLYLFRRIYVEVVTALPVNGGTYNLLLNTTSKSNAAIAACFTMLSYVTTAVISATSAMRYLHSLCDHCAVIGPTPNDSVIIATLLTLSIAAALNLAGISESAIVALVIFLFHMGSMGLLIIFSLLKAVTDMPTMALTEAQIQSGECLNLAQTATQPEMLLAHSANYTLSLPNASCTCYNNNALHNVSSSFRNAVTQDVSVLTYNWLYTCPVLPVGAAIYFGFSSALLGISGFESSSNFVENQKEGVFPLTLRNMWMAVSIINVSVAFFAQCLLPVDQIAAQAEGGALLSLMAETASGPILKLIIVIDASLVLIGAVITAFVGFTGLVHRMSVDRCLPQLFLRVNHARRTRHWIIFSLWLMASLLTIGTAGNVEVLAGVYTVAFLSVMLSFTVGNMLLKLRRSSLPTPVRVPWSIVMLASVCVTAGLVGNIVSRPRSLPSLLIFGAIFILPVQAMLNRVSVFSVIKAITAKPTNKSKMLSEMSLSISTNIELDELFAEAMRSVHELLDADRATLWLIDHHNEEIWSKIAEGVPEIRVPLGKGIVGWVTNTGETLNIPNAYDDARFNPEVDKKTGYMTRTILCMPIFSTPSRSASPGSPRSPGSTSRHSRLREKKKMVGVFQVINKNGSEDGAIFTEEDERLLRIFCFHLSTAVENCQRQDATKVTLESTLTDLRQKLESTQATLRAMQHASSSERLDLLFRDTVQAARKLVSGDRATLFLVDSAKEELWSKVAEGMDMIRAPMGKGICGWVATNNQPLNIKDAYADSRFNRDIDARTGYRTRNILCVPIRDDDDDSVIIGVIQVINKIAQGSDFSAADLRLLEDFCAQLSPAVKSCQNIEDAATGLATAAVSLVERLAKAKALSAQSFNALFEIGMQAVCELLQADRAILYLMDGDQKVRRVHDDESILLETSSIISEVIATREAIRIPEAHKDPRFNKSIDEVIEETQSILCAPIVDDHAVLGAIQVINKKDGSSGEIMPFTETEVKMLKCFCEGIARAVKLFHSESVLEKDDAAQIQNAAAYMLDLRHVSKIAARSSSSSSSNTRALHVLENELHAQELTLSRSSSLHSISNISSNEGQTEEDEPRRGSCCRRFPICDQLANRIHHWASRQVLALVKKPAVYFTKDDGAQELNAAIRYILNNEQRRWIKFVRVFPSENAIPARVPEIYAFLQDAYPELLIEYTAMVGKFGPDAVRSLAYQEKISSTFMFMGSFSKEFEFSFEEMGGLRLITGNFVTPLRRASKQS
eukprot:g1763.t1